MIDSTSMCIMAGCAMAIMIAMWVIVAFSDTKTPIKVKKTMRNCGNGCVMCDATIPEGRQVYPNCEAGVMKCKKKRN